MASTEDLIKVVEETTGGKLSPEQVSDVLNRDFSPIKNDWRSLASTERKQLESLFQTSGNRDEALSQVLGNWDKEFGAKRIVRPITTDRDIYNNLREVYDKSGGDWDMVGRVAKYNNVPKDLMNKFVKDGKWTDYSLSDEFGSGVKSVAYGIAGNLAGGVGGALGGAEGFFDTVPEGISYDDEINTGWRRGIRQSEAEHQSRTQTDPGMEIIGNLLGFIGPAGLASKAVKSINVVGNASRIGRGANALTRSLLAGGLASSPMAITAETPSEAVYSLASGAGAFAAGDTIGAGLGYGLGLIGRGAGKIASRARPRENIVKGIRGLKTEDVMSAGEKEIALKHAIKNADGTYTRNLSREMAEAGRGNTENIDSVLDIAKNNRTLYNKLKNEVEHFNLGEDISAASSRSLIPNAPLSRVSRILKTIPERLKQFSDDPLGYQSYSGRAIKTMEEFNADIKHALRSIKNPNNVEKKAIEAYLKDVETANMMQHIKNGLVIESKAKDVSKDVASEFGRIFQITNPVSAVNALTSVAQNRMERDLIKKAMKGEPMTEKTLSRLKVMLSRLKNKDQRTIMERVLFGTMLREQNNKGQ